MYYHIEAFDSTGVCQMKENIKIEFDVSPRKVGLLDVNFTYMRYKNCSTALLAIHNLVHLAVPVAEPAPVCRVRVSSVHKDYM